MLILLLFMRNVMITFLVLVSSFVSSTIVSSEKSVIVSQEGIKNSIIGDSVVTKIKTNTNTNASQWHSPNNGNDNDNNENTDNDTDNDNTDTIKENEKTTLGLQLSQESQESQLQSQSQEDMTLKRSNSDIKVKIQNNNKHKDNIKDKDNNVIVDNGTSELQHSIAVEETMTNFAGTKMTTNREKSMTSSIINDPIETGTLISTTKTTKTSIIIDPIETSTKTSFSSKPTKTNTVTSERIVGGKPVLHSMYPTFVFNGCGGTLIQHDLVLTAAHCVPNFYEKPFVFIGTKNDTTTIPSDTTTITTDTDSYYYEKIPIERIIAHPKWSWDTQQNDIAILKLACSSRMPIQQLNTNIHYPPINDFVTVIGYGSTQPGGPYSDLLRAVSVQVIDGQQCYYNYGNDWIVNTTMICAGTNIDTYNNGDSTTDIGKDACGGDSGGPLFHYQQNYDDDDDPTNGTKILVQVGIVSFGFGCGSIQYPGVYTRVSAYQYWIQRIIQYYSQSTTTNSPNYCTVASNKQIRNQG